MRMTKVQAEALAAFVARIRPEWRPAGILAALEKAAATADVHDVACALIRLAEDGTVAGAVIAAAVLDDGDLDEQLRRDREESP